MRKIAHKPLPKKILERLDKAYDGLRNPNTKATKVKGGKFNLEVTCETCGKPITVSNEHGMFCEDMCGLKEAKKATKALNALINEICKDDE